MIKLALVGRLHTGKDTTARVLHDALGLHPFALAGPLKDHCSRAFDLPREWFDDQAWKNEVVLYRRNAGAAPTDDDRDPPTHITLRRLLQREGQAARAVHGEDVWVNATLRAIDMHVAREAAAGRQVPGIVVTDVRRWNELHLLVAAGYTAIRLNRADREMRHGHVNVSPEGPCAYTYGVGLVCGMPESSHPTSWSENRDVTEVELPDGSDHYSTEIETSSADATAAAALAWVARRFGVPQIKV